MSETITTNPILDILDTLRISGDQLTARQMYDALSTDGVLNDAQINKALDLLKENGLLKWFEGGTYNIKAFRHSIEPITENPSSDRDVEGKQYSQSEVRWIEVNTPIENQLQIINDLNGVIKYNVEQAQKKANVQTMAQLHTLAHKSKKLSEIPEQEELPEALPPTLTITGKHPNFEYAMENTPRLSPGFESEYQLTVINLSNVELNDFGIYSKGENHTMNSDNIKVLQPNRKKTISVKFAINNVSDDFEYDYDIRGSYTVIRN